MNNSLLIALGASLLVAALLVLAAPRLRRTTTPAATAEDPNRKLAAPEAARAVIRTADTVDFLDLVITAKRRPAKARDLELLIPADLPLPDGALDKILVDEPTAGAAVVVAVTEENLPDDLAIPGVLPNDQRRKTRPAAPNLLDAPAPAWTPTEGYVEEYREPHWRELNLPEDVPDTYLGR